MAEAHKVIPVRGTGAGKTKLAPARGFAGIRQEKWIRFFNDVDLVNQLDRAQQGREARGPTCRMGGSDS